MLNNQQILDQLETQKRSTLPSMRGQHQKAWESHVFHAGDTMYYTASVEDKGSRKVAVFNKVKPYVDAVVGTMIQIRRKPEYYARVTDQQALQLYTGFITNFSDYCRKTANMEFVETQQDREMLITGYGAVDTGISYEKNPDGDTVAECLRFNDVFWDPLAKESNLLDARWCWRQKPLSREEVEECYADIPIEEFDSYNGMTGNTEYYPDGGEYNQIQVDGTVDIDLLQVTYYQWWNLQKYYRVENPAHGIEDEAMRQEFLLLLGTLQETREEMSTEEEREDLFTFDPQADYLSMTPQQYKDVQALCEQYGVECDGIKQRRKCYYTALITGKRVLRKFKSPNQDGFTIKFKTANYDPTTRIWYGMVESLKNPADYANKALTEILFIIASNSKGGVLYEEDAVDDPRRFEEQYASTRAAIQVNSGALGAGKIQPKAQASMSNGYEQVLAYSDTAMGEVSGISKEFLGTATNKQVAALLESQRINQVLATLAVYFDAISLYQLEHARMMITYMRILAENSQGRLIRIMGKDGAATYLQLSQDKMTDEYDVDIGETPTTPAQKEQATQVMIDFADKMAQFGQNIYGQIIQYLPITQQDKQALSKAITPSPEQQQAQAMDAQHQKQVQDAMNGSIIQGTKAKAAADMSKAQLNLASIPKALAGAQHEHALTVKELGAATATHVDATIAHKMSKNPSMTTGKKVMGQNTFNQTATAALAP